MLRCKNTYIHGLITIVCIVTVHSMVSKANGRIPAKNIYNERSNTKMAKTPAYPAYTSNNTITRLMPGRMRTDLRVAGTPEDTKQSDAFEMVKKSTPVDSVGAWKGCGSKQDAFESMAVVLVSDNKYMPCTLSLVSSIVKVGRWKGHIILLSGMEFVMTNKTEQILADFCVEVRRVAKWYTKKLPRATPNPNGSKWLRMHVFTDPFFRKYEKLLYMDTDGIVKHDIRGLFAIADTSTLIMRDNGMGMKKGTLLKSEMFSVKFEQIPNQGQIMMSDTPHPGASAFFVLDVTKLPPPAEISQHLYDILATYGGFFKYNDQTLINLYFRRQYSVMAPCFQNIQIVHPDNSMHVKAAWFIEACPISEQIYVHDYKKTCM